MKTVRTLPTITKQHAIVYMIGQMEQMAQPVNTAVVAAWIGCTKQTAKKYLDTCAVNGQVEKRVETWRGEATVHYWHTTRGARILMDKGVYRNAYQLLLATKGIIND